MAVGGHLQGWETNDEEGSAAIAANRESESTAASCRSQSAPQLSENLDSTKRPSTRPKTSNISHGTIKEVHPPSSVIIARARTPPAPVLPRKAIPSKPASYSRQPVPGVLVNSAAEQVYYGDVKGSRPHGWGKLYLTRALHSKENKGKGRLLYDGQWARGNRHGYGIIYYNSGDIYEGCIVNDKRQGKGKLLYHNGDVYIGHWENNDRHGRGSVFYATGSCFSGWFVRNKKNGRGQYWNTQSQLLYEGDWIDDRIQVGTMSPVSGQVLEIVESIPIPEEISQKMNAQNTSTSEARLPKLAMDFIEVLYTATLEIRQNSSFDIPIELLAKHYREEWRKLNKTSSSTNKQDTMTSTRSTQNTTQSASLAPESKNPSQVVSLERKRIDSALSAKEMEALRMNFFQLSQSPRCTTLKEENDAKNQLLDESKVKPLLISSGLDMAAKRTIELYNVILGTLNTENNLTYKKLLEILIVFTC